MPQRWNARPTEPTPRDERDSKRHSAARKLYTKKPVKRPAIDPKCWSEKDLAFWMSGEYDMDKESGEVQVMLQLASMLNDARVEWLMAEARRQSKSIGSAQTPTATHGTCSTKARGIAARLLGRISNLTDTAWKPRGEFSHNWFANLTARLWSGWVLPHVAKIDGPLNYLELGVAESQSLLWAIEHLGRPGGLFVGVDPFLPSRNWRPDEGNQHRDKALSNLSLLFGHRPRKCEDDNGKEYYHFRQSGTNLICNVWPESSTDFLPRAGNAFDVVYVDANHDAPFAMLDILLAFNLLKLGGLLIVDDYERFMRGGRPQVKPSCDAFELIQWGYYDVLYKHPKQACYEKVRRRRRGEYPPMLVRGPVIAPDGETG